MSDDKVRDALAWIISDPGGTLPYESGESVSQWTARAILASDVLATIKADAWHEGYAVGVRVEATDEWGADPARDNPYRAEGSA